jgi:hypothetical protein
MKVEQRIGRIDRISQRHRDISALNLCYADSAEHIVYGRLLRRLAEVGMIIGTQQMSLLPVTPEEFLDLADGTLSAETLERRAIERARSAQQRKFVTGATACVYVGFPQRLRSASPGCYSISTCPR